MHRRGLPRRLAALLAIAALVFAQALIAGYACVPATPADEAAAPCHEPDGPGPDALCKAHCEAGTQTVDQAKPLSTPALGSPLVVLRADDLAHIGPAPSARLTDWLAHAGAPPPILLHRRLRI
ncbi:MAG TPA: hypothetical protein VLD36_05670 [Burkholderiales bacterium]|jgi:hypothetical protein|nr:hypothetical protein [Burkholderiales bacterium]